MVVDQISKHEIKLDPISKSLMCCLQWISFDYTVPVTRLLNGQMSYNSYKYMQPVFMKNPVPEYKFSIKSVK